jgi:phenylacetate-CoA ligase
MDLHARMIQWILGPLWARWEKSPYLRRYRQLLRSQFDDPVTIRARQWNAVEKLIHHAFATVPFYRNRFEHLRLSPAAIRNFDDYLAVPLLTKADIRAAGTGLLSYEFDPSRLLRKKTSGSTGVSLETFVDEDSLQWKRACTLRSDEWSGWRFGERVAAVWGNPDYLTRGWRGRLRNALLDRKSYLDTLKMDEAALASFAAALRRSRPSLIFGHAHSVYLLAQYLQDDGGCPVRPAGIITTAMVLHNWQRSLIEKVFGCKVTNRYGCEEVSLIACECERHDGLHINADGVYVEVLRDGKPAPPGEPGAVVVTDLTNRAMPLLRYQVGDMAVLAARPCPCGRGLPLLQRLDGREADYVVTADGELISGISLTENFALQVTGIAQIQIVQQTVEHFLFRIVRAPDFDNSSLARLRMLVRERFGPAVSFTCEFVSRIPQEPSGKYRFCISHVAHRFTPGRRRVVA